MNRQANHEAMREKISFSQSLNKIQEIEDKLMSFAEPEYVFDQEAQREIRVYKRPDPVVVASLKTVLDSCWRRIAKLLPDAKLITEEEANSKKMLDREEMKRRMLAYLTGSGVKVLPPPEEGPSQD